MRSLLSLHQVFARLAATVLSARLRTTVALKVASLEQGLYEEYVDLVPERSLVNTISLQPLEGRLWLEIPVDLAVAMVERLLGGQEDAGEPPQRELTDIELALVGSIVQSLLNALREAWAGVMAVNPALLSTTGTRQLAQVGGAADTMLILVFDTQIGGKTTSFSMCIPHLTLELALPHLAGQEWSAGGRGGPREQDPVIEQHVRRARLTVTGVIGEAELSIDEAAHLQPGDVVLFDTLSGGRSLRVQVRVENRFRFSGTPGVVGGRLGVRIERAEEWNDGRD